jgi:hypothetical protein
MSEIITNVARIDALERVNSSTAGNPRFRIAIDGRIMLTKVNAGWAYEIGQHYVGRKVHYAHDYRIIHSLVTLPLPSQTETPDVQSWLIDESPWLPEGKYLIRRFGDDMTLTHKGPGHMTWDPPARAVPNE